MDKWCEKSLVKYSCQIIILAIVIIAFIVNLFFKQDERVFGYHCCVHFLDTCCQIVVAKERMNELLSCFSYLSFLGK